SDLNASARLSRSASGLPLAGEGITWNVCRSPIHGLGSWLAVNAWISGLFCALLSVWLLYSHRVELASVIGDQKLKPCGTAVAGKLLPREKLPVECVPLVVITYSATLW